MKPTAMMGLARLYILWQDENDLPGAKAASREKNATPWEQKESDQYILNLTGEAKMKIPDIIPTLEVRHGA